MPKPRSGGASAAVRCNRRLHAARLLTRLHYEHISNLCQTSDKQEVNSGMAVTHARVRELLWDLARSCSEDCGEKWTIAQKQENITLLFVDVLKHEFWDDAWDQAQWCENWYIVQRGKLNKVIGMYDELFKSSTFFDISSQVCPPP